MGKSLKTLSSYENNTTSPGIDFINLFWEKYHEYFDKEDYLWLIRGEKRGTGTPGEYASVPLYDVKASAGGGKYVAEEKTADVLVFRREWIANELRVSEKDLFVIFVEGDSMTPTLNPGDILLVVEYHGEPITDGVYVIRLEDTLLVKRLQRLPRQSLQVSSDNPVYSVFNVSLERSSTDFAIIGRVVWAGKRF